jgi:uncharacterized protein YgbK (DUF1537 family)
MRVLPLSALDKPPAAREAEAEALLRRFLTKQPRKILALDDDPTGIQTVYGVPVYTGWNRETILEGFREEGNLFFIMTNSRAMTADQTEAAHRGIARGIMAAKAETGRDFILVSRSDSTLRGHYPLETEALREELEKAGHPPFDGEIICPFFPEGGRYTLNNVHYVREGGALVPAGQTEFARDRTFGYGASDLRDWCAEKTAGAVKAGEVICIPLEELRTLQTAAVRDRLLAASGFAKIIVNAAAYGDLKVFAAAFFEALSRGKNYLFRSAAAVPKALAGVPDRPLLTRAELLPDAAGGQESAAGGLVIIGSHVNRTSAQLAELRKSGAPLEFIEFNQHLITREGGLGGETRRVRELADNCIAAGITAAVYTLRDRIDFGGGDRELAGTVRIADALTAVAAGLARRPAFIIAKGGITSSDIGVKALKVHRAVVMGQVKPGVPVWLTGPESRFPGLPYIIFPGNVGDDATLREIVEMLV